MKNALVYFVLLFYLFFSCKEKEDEGILSLSVDSLEFPSESSVKNVQIECDRDWHIESTIGWISFIPTSGNGNATLEVIVASNDEDTDRTSSFYVTADKLSEGISVTQKGTYLSVDSVEVLFDRDGTPQEVTITTRYAWTIDNSEALWCEVEPMEGSGSGTITLTPQSMTEREPRYDDRIRIVCNGSSYYITISQDVENTPPIVPELISPVDTVLPSIYPYFEWTESVDADGDTVLYCIQYSTNENFTTYSQFGPFSETSYLLNDPVLLENKNYYWRVKAFDDYWGGDVYSEIGWFKTSGNIIYANDSIFIEQRSNVSSGLAPTVVFLGDGFTQEDFAKGSLFDLVSQTAIESFFVAEPFSTYKEYFNVYRIVTYSDERGATVYEDFTDYDVPAQEVNTAFNSNFAGGRSLQIRCNTDTVFEYVVEKLSESPDIEFTEEDLDNTTIVLMINLEVYAGTTGVSRTGRSIAMCPIGRETFAEVVCHEGAGHGFGRLLDEYIHYPSVAITEQEREWIESFRNDDDPWTYGANISFTNDKQEVHWKHYFNLPEYAVSVLPGGLTYGLDVWHAEEYSCMFDNLFYFNAPSREAIVRRIMQITNPKEEFDWDAFHAKDIQKSYLPAGMASSIKRSAKKLPEPIIIY